MIPICLPAFTLALAAPAAVDPAEPLEGIPFVVGRLDSATIRRPLPGLFLNRQEMERARRRAAEDPRAGAIRDRLVAQAEAGLQEAVETPDDAWWATARDKPWSQTYPEVFEHTVQRPQRIARAAWDLATAWWLTGREQYARQAGRRLALLADYSFAPEHYDVGMNYAVWGCRMLAAYELLLESLPADLRDRLDACFARMAWAIARNDRFWLAHDVGGGINNHLAWHKLMLGLLGLFYDRPDMVDYCVHGPRGLAGLLAVGLTDDGLWCESSLVYQVTATAPMLLFADCRRRWDGDVSLLEGTFADGRTLKQSFDAMFDTLGPGLMVPPVGDAYAARWRLADMPAMELAWAAWGDPRYAWLLKHCAEPGLRSLTAPAPPPDAPAPAVRSRLFPEHGYVFLRSHADAEYWHNPAALCAFLTFDRAGVHSNADKLGLMLFAGDRLLLPDREARASVPHAFSSRVQAELNRSTLCHNTVMIDSRDQRSSPLMLDLIEYRDLPPEKRVTAADLEGRLYEGVRQMRTLALTDAYLLDVFQVDGGDVPRQTDWLAHVMDEPADSDGEPAGMQPVDLPREGPWRWLSGARAAPVTGPVELGWKAGSAGLRLCMLDPGQATLILCGFPTSDDPQGPTVPMLIVRRVASRSLFAALWLPGAAAGPAALRQVGDLEGRLQFEVQCGGSMRRHLVPRLQAVRRR